MTKAILFSIVFSLFAACGKDEAGNEEEPPVAATKKGFHTSKERPVGDPVVLPAGVTVSGKTMGYSEFTPEFCDNKTEDDAQGVGSMVRICVPFFNNNNFPVEVTLPPGVIWIARQVPGEKDSSRIQNGMLVDQANFLIPGKTIYYQPLYLCCLNSGRSTSSPMYEYEMGPVTIDADMKSLLDILQTKKLTKDPTLAAHVQSAVWDITSSKPISARDMAVINALPNK